MNDLISVIVPVYNAEKYIKKCVDSIKKQSYTNFELILINDGSKDASLGLCKQLAESDERIVVLNRSNGGASAARNTGLDAAKGEYIVFVDSDDFVSPNYLENLYRAAKVGNYDIVQCDLQYIGKEDFNAPTVVFLKTDIKEITKVDALNKRLYKVSVWGKIYTKEIFDDFHFREGIIYEDDASYYIFVYRAKKIAILNEMLYFYYMSQNSVMRNTKKNKSTAFLQIYEDRIKYFKDCDEAELVDGTYNRFCLVLMLTYASSVHNKTNLEDIDCFLKIFRKYYPFALKSNKVSLQDKCMLIAFNTCPKIIGKIIGRMRG